MAINDWAKRGWELLAGKIHYSWLGWSHRLPKVRRLNWEITDACNSRCELCNIWKQKPSAQMLTLAEIKKAFSDPLFDDLEWVILTGGEPVLRPDLLQVISFLAQRLKKVRFSLSTNALLPDRVLTLVDECLAKGINIDVGVSVDGVGEHHDRIRGVRGNFDKVDLLIDNLLQLRQKHKKNFVIVAGQTIHPLTLDYIDEVRDYARRKNIAYLPQLFDDAPYYYNVGEKKQFDSGREKMIKVIDKMPGSPHNEILLKILREGRIKFDCYAMRTFFILRCNGDVMPCLRKCDGKIGNVREQSPTEIWESAAAKKARSEAAACQGCSNTWATDWSMSSNFWPFREYLYNALCKRLTSSK